MDATVDGRAPAVAHTICWMPVSPKALLEIDGLLYRCPVCHCLVLDIDRCLHAEHHTAA